MLKACWKVNLCGNTSAEKKKNSRNRDKIEFRVQEKEGLKLASKLSKTHVFYKNERVTVKRAAKMPNTSLADALSFLSKLLTFRL